MPDLRHLGIVATLKELATETERTAEKFRRNKSSLDDEARYSRFNVARGLEDVGLEESRKQREIAAATGRRRKFLYYVPTFHRNVANPSSQDFGSYRIPFSLDGHSSFNLFSQQERVAIIVVAAKSGAPVNRVPVYAEITAEVGRRGERAPVPLDDGLAQLDLANERKEALPRAFRQEINWPQALQAAHDDESLAKSRLRAFLHAVVDIAQRLADPDSHLTFSQWVKEVVKTAKTLPEFATLQGSGEGGVAIKYSFHVYPGLLEKTKFNALDQKRVTRDAILAKYEMAQSDFASIPRVGLALPSMQNPSLIEWKLSPGSFAAVPQLLIGTDGCEIFTPANFATAQFNLRQVAHLAPEANDALPNTTYPNGLINEYTLSLIPIGHSLGSILYTLPLAPGESVRLAVIDWRRTDIGQRDEKMVITESLVHDQTRDRAISETISAALDEWQRGGSVMGGIAAGAGGSASVGVYGVAGGGMASIGGAYTTSSGSRKLTSDSLQKVADAVHQASNAVREIQNSVVVQTDSVEKENVQTRTFFNNNRAHTMTVMYYEMLRHFRVVVRFTRQYKALLVPRTPWTFDMGDRLILDKEHVLYPALLDETLRPAFDAVRRADMAQSELQRNPPPPASSDTKADFAIINFRMSFKVGERSSNALAMKVVTKTNPEPVDLKYHGQTNINDDPTLFNQDSPGGFVIVTDVAPPIKWGDLQEFRFRKTSGSDNVSVYELSITATGANGESRLVHPHIPGDYYFMVNEGVEYRLSVVPPPPAPPAKPEATWQRGISIEDYSLILRPHSHIDANREYYTRLFDLSVHPNEYATRFETVNFDSRMLIDVVSPSPAEILGTKIAFPLLNQGTDTSPKDIPDEERLIALPTRGVFAEAKLGHCNVAEEIDDTRFWRWDEHPNQIVATEIQPVKVAEPAPKDLSLAPTTMPQSIVDIQQPLAAPDPAGLAAALKAISTPNIFRDMSGAAEVQQLLHDLIERSVSMAKAASVARNIQAKQAAAAGGGQAAADPAASRAQAEDNRVRDQQVTPAQAQYGIKLADNQAQQGKITQQQASDIAANQLSNMKGSQKPKPLPKAPKKWRVEVTLRGYGNMILDGMWSWELSQGGTSLGFELMDRRENGVFKIPFLLEGDDRRFKLSVSGEILHGYGINATFSGKEMIFEIPADTFAKSDFAYVTLEAVTATFKFTTKSSEMLKKSWMNSASLSVSPPGAVKQIISIIGAGGQTWGRDETHTMETAEEFTITYYPSGFTVKEVK
ncbi:hypothetical protein B0J13DRAFT_676475 [Dactylonectria estremocensis]|uniref:Uncharacterized protein n=1 Tax=Dactylonectria estremocensis TaxID=1079267 RepID=A0A9P9J156_9HYPO|nr:hypothetical protein B0J13DRAFT_676475 [Dactylonectria estremocensis]